MADAGPDRERQGPPADFPKIDTVSKNEPNVFFFLQRNKNWNTVVYCVNRTDDGEINPKDPVRGYWHDYAKDLTLATVAMPKLGMIERKLLYGINSKPHAEAGKYICTLTALPARTVTVYLKDGKPVGEMEIGGKVAFITNIYSEADESSLRPKVLWVDLVGTSIETGEPAYERITP